MFSYLGCRASKPGGCNASLKSELSGPAAYSSYAHRPHSIVEVEMSTCPTAQIREHTRPYYIVGSWMSSSGAAGPENIQASLLLGRCTTSW